MGNKSVFCNPSHRAKQERCCTIGRVPVSPETDFFERGDAKAHCSDMRDKPIIILPILSLIKARLIVINQWAAILFMISDIKYHPF